MEENGKSQKNNNLIIAEFKSDTEIQKKPPANFDSNQSNPILNRLYKLTHKELMHRSDNYKSFSKFKPKDLY